MFLKCEFSCQRDFQELGPLNVCVGGVRVCGSGCVCFGTVGWMGGVYSVCILRVGKILSLGWGAGMNGNESCLLLKLNFLLRTNH